MELEDFIKKTEEEIHKKHLILKECKAFEQTYKYFKKLKRQRGAYIVTMRVVMARRLFEKNLFTYDQIGMLLSKDHATIMYLIKVKPEPRIAKIVEDNIDYWIKENLYPISTPSFEASYKGGFKHITTYKLKSI